jgi:hypothetical protein
MLESLSKFTDVKEVNINKDERWASLLIGAILLLYAMIRIPLSAVLAALASAYLFFRGIRGFCYFYDKLGKNKAVDFSLASGMKNNHMQETVVSLNRS